MPRNLLFAAGLACVSALPAPESGYAQIAVGEYASRQVVVTRALTRPRGRYARVPTTSLVHHTVFEGDDGLRVVNRYCSVEQEPLGPVQTELGPSFVAAIEPKEASITVSGPEAGPWDVVVGETVTVIGAELENPDSDPLPAEPDDPRVVDADSDGNPGVTVQVRGLIDGEVYMVQRLVRELRGRLEADRTMSGVISGRNESEVLGASNVVLRTFTPKFEPDRDGDDNVFDWVPLADGTTCDALVADARRLFEGD